MLQRVRGDGAGLRRTGRHGALIRGEKAGWVVDEEKKRKTPGGTHEWTSEA